MKKNNNHRKGLSIIEVLLASAIFVVMATAAVTAVISGQNVNRVGGEETVATQYAQEGLDAVRSIRNQSFASLTNSITGLSRNSSNVWVFSGGGNATDSGRFARAITIADVCRDGAGGTGSIVDCPGTSTDPNTKKVTSSVNWNFNSTRQINVTLSEYFTNWKAPIVTAPTGGPIMMAYSKTTSTPFYRSWNGSTWSAEGSAQVVGGNINYIVLKSSRTRDEAVLATLDSAGNIYAQVWNGTIWSAPTLMANVGASNATTRSFDVSYEKNGDRAMVSFLNGSASADFSYRLWDGTSWSSATPVTTSPTTGVIKWLEMKQNPLSASNEIAMILYDANSDVYGLSWNGSSWGTMGVASVWDPTTSTATTKKGIDVEYEQLSGHAMFIWGDATATDQYYRIWNGTSLTAATLLDIPATGGISEWVQLTARPNSDELLYGVQDAGSDLNTRKWSGSAWDTATQHPEHDATVENITTRGFDIVWETHSANPGKAWILWGDGATVSMRQWSGSAWGSVSVLTGSDDTSFLRLRADPTSGAVFVGIYENSTSATDDIWESHLTGGSSIWSAENTIWAGPTSATPVFFRIDISAP